MELNSHKAAITHNLQLLYNEQSIDERDIPVTRKVPNTNMTRNQQTPQKRKRLSELSESDTDVNLDIPAKKIDITIIKQMNLTLMLTRKLKNYRRKKK